MTARRKVLALAGGVGGAKLVCGLARTCAPRDLTVVVNTADDFEHLGFHIAPDLDSVMYALAGCSDPETGWGLADETWSFMQAMERLGGDTWFRLGDRDLATHVERTRRLRAGATLSQATAALCQAFGIAHRVAPMSDDPVRTIVAAGRRRYAFQEYFVRLRCAPAVTGFAFAGARDAAPAPALAAALADDALAAVVVCPSNPYVSIDPIRALPAVERFLAAGRAPAVAVSPIVGGAAVKGPAAKMMRELGREASALGVARHYAGAIDGLVIDRADRALAPPIEALGLRVLVTGTVMRTPADRVRLAGETLAFAESVRRPV